MPATTKVTSESAAGYGAIALFTDRAVSVEKTFALTDKNAPAVAEICRRLDGIPLAIELAAARVKVLSPRQLAQKLDERFRVLTGGDRSALPRQQTMRALIDWSYDLLSKQEQRLFRELSVFAGSFSTQMAMDVCATAEISEFDVLDLLSSLVDKSFVLSEPAEPVARCRLLESIRQYGREKATELGEVAAFSSRHAEAYAALAEHLEADYENVAFEGWLEQAESEFENIRAALAWSFGASGQRRGDGRNSAARRGATRTLRSNARVGDESVPRRAQGRGTRARTLRSGGPPARHRQRAALVGSRSGLPRRG